MRTVLVTGGASGIGWAAARRFAAAGDVVVIADIDGAAATARATSLGPQHAAIAADVADPATAAAVLAFVLAQRGRIDVLVNNAGVIDSGGTPITEQPLAALRRLLGVNLIGMERLARAAHAVMATQAPLAAGAPRGIIVNMASGAALRAIPLRNGYSASKAGVLAMTRVQAVEWAAVGVRVNALAPGYIRTDLVDELIRRGRVDPTLTESRIPLGRMGRPEEMAEAVFFLASPAARGMLGSLLIADGAGAAYGASDAAPVQRGAPPRLAPDGTPVIAVSGAETAMGAACLRGLTAAGVIAFAAATPDDIAAAASRHGRLDGLVNAAGTDHLDALHADLPEQLAHHLEAQFLAAQVAGRIMLAQGFGAVLNLTGAGALAAGAAPVAGSAAAGAVAMFARSMACEWGGSGVRVNALAVGAGIDPGGAAAFLLSPAAGYVSGAIIAMDGGRSILASTEPAAWH